MIRTPDEIVEYYRQEQSNDLFGWKAEVVFQYLTPDQLKEFLREGADLSDWPRHDLTREQIVGDMAEYVAYAWDKIENHRGLSAERSVEKIGLWIWLLGDDDFLRVYHQLPYPMYGAPMMMAASTYYNLPYPDNERVQRMAGSLPCIEDCDRGCGIRSTSMQSLVKSTFTPTHPPVI